LVNRGNAYTGGYFQDRRTKGVLFATPLIASHCDNTYPSTNTPYPYNQVPLPVSTLLFSNHPVHLLLSEEYEMPYYAECLPFKREDPAPELVMPVKDDSEIIIFYDRIIVKDIPANVSYQIYTIHGQLIVSSATTADISTAQLSKGIYILRLENGKAFKFVK